MEYFKVYDCYDRETKIPTLGSEIKEVFVVIVSGDETGIVRFKDGTMNRFDAYNDAEEFRGFRTMSFYDGCYIVHNHQLEEWQKCGEENTEDIVRKRRNLFRPRGWWEEDEEEE
jgi:hypothetical protein